jgi:hypothetical protein
MSVMAVRTGALKGKYVLTSMSVENKLFVRIGDGPAGPFGDRHDVYVTPEWSPADSVLTYNAKAHPSLSRDGSWLVTYNVNTTSWSRNLSDADIYHPRFLWLRFDPAAGIPAGPGRKARGSFGVTWDGSRFRWDDAGGKPRGADGRSRLRP